MNILIPYSWLKEYLKTNAAPKDIAKALTLCGPTVDNTVKRGDDWIYNIEVTTNRVDAMSVYGIAREAAAILPEFGFSAKLAQPKEKIFKNRKDLGIDIENNPKLCKRILAIKLKEVKIAPSPTWLKEKLDKVGQRPLNNAIDITNYVMWELGHPIHAFDYDRIKNKKIVVREARKGEKLVTLDNISYTLSGGEVIFDNGKGEIIDLPGIMGTANTVVTPSTKNILLWIESVDPAKIRKASMGLNIRSQAAVLNEKHVDPELGLPTILRAIDLYKKVTTAKVASKLVDIYEEKYKAKKIKLDLDFIVNRLGLPIRKQKITNILSPLGFKSSWSKDNLTVIVPTFRAHDISIPEDIVEEVARIYGYHNLPSNLMHGKLPNKIPDSPFNFEHRVKEILVGLGGVEVYTLSLVPKDWVAKGALKLKNPLGADTEYLRTNMFHSLVASANENRGEKEPYHLFEMANIYLPRMGDLPEERTMLAGIFVNTGFRDAKGVIESLLEQLNIKANFIPEDRKSFLPCQRLSIKFKNIYLGQFGVLEVGFIYYEFEVETLSKLYIPVSSYKPIPKYPEQIEDITLKLPERTRVGDLIEMMKSSNNLIEKIELTDIFEDFYTFRLWYQHPRKTLTDIEVEKIREKLLREVKQKFGAVIK